MNSLIRGQNPIEMQRYADAIPQQNPLLLNGQTQHVVDSQITWGQMGNIRQIIIWHC